MWYSFLVQGEEETKSLNCFLNNLFSRKRNQNYLVAAASLFIVLSHGYLHFSALPEIDGYPTDLSFEDSDPKDQLDDQRHESDIVIEGIPPIKLLPEKNPFRQSSYHFSPVPFPDQAACVLRC